MSDTNYTTKHRKINTWGAKKGTKSKCILKDGWSIYRIAKNLGRPYYTIKTEIKRDTVVLCHRKV